VAEPAHSLEEVCVSREVDASRAAKDVADRLRAHAPPTHAWMLCMCDLQCHLAHPQHVSGAYGGEAGEAKAFHEWFGAARNDEDCAACKPPQRGHVQVVPVEVRDGYHVGVTVEVGCRSGSPKMSDSPSQQGIGDDARPVELENDRAVPEPGEPRRPHQTSAV